MKTNKGQSGWFRESKEHRKARLLGLDKKRKKRNKMEEWGYEPYAYTKRGKVLYADTSTYDRYTSATGSIRLIGSDGRFWGYSDSKELRRV